MKKVILLPLASILFFLLVAVPSFAQLTVVEGAAMNMDPLELIQNYLVGQGVTVSNATFNGSFSNITTSQIGTFSTHGVATQQLGLTGGILMTSGKASIAIGPNNSGGAGQTLNGPADPDLNIIANATTLDRGALEFDFIPQFDTIRFRYVFASEEFFEYCNSYNDAFGFFLSGPGINGTFSNNSKNIALMPGSQTLYVTINNICANVFSRWDNAGGVNYQYDGLTRVFTAWHVVQPCSTYHIKLAIADAKDTKFDSGVFLEENSFGSPGVTINSVNTIPVLQNKALEGCNDVVVSFKLSQPVIYSYKVNLNVSGTATNGDDYTTIPPFIIFPPGQDSVGIVIHPISDNIPEGPERLIIKINQISCNGSVEMDTIWIDDYSEVEIEPLSDTTICHGQSVKLRAEVTGGLRPFTYLWNSVPSADSIMNVVPPVGVNNYILGVKDVCQLTTYDTSVITVHPTPIASAGSSNVTIPNGTSYTLNGSASGGYGDYSYSWTSNPPGFTSTIPNPNTGNLYASKIYILVVTDLQSGCESEQSKIIVAVEGGPLSVNPVAEPPAVCLGTPSQLFALPGGGSGLYTFSWTSDPPGFTSTLQDPEVLTYENTTYTVIADDGYNQISGSTDLTINPLPVIYLGPVDSTVCIYDSVLLDAGNPGSTYEWSDGSTSRQISISASGIGFEIQTYKVWVKNERSCVDSATINVIFSFNACVGINERNDNDDFRVYPNPSDGNFTIQLNPHGSDLSIGIYNLLGKKVFSQDLITFPGHLVEKEINASYLPEGLYILKLSGNNFSGSRKIQIK